jgi:hypothetical protein
MKNYIDFIEVLSKDQEIENQFKTRIKNESPNDLSAWFKTMGYMVSEGECAIITKNQQHKALSSTVMTAYTAYTAY